MPAKMYPVIPPFLIADDVFLIAYCLKHNILLQLYSEAKVYFHGSSSFYRWIPRYDRASNTAKMIANFLPEKAREKYAQLLLKRAVPARYKEDIAVLYRIRFWGRYILDKMRPHSEKDSWGVDHSTKISPINTKEEIQMFFDKILFARLYYLLKPTQTHRVAEEIINR